MSSNKLDVGATVRFTRPERFEAMPKAAAAVFRVESLLKMPDGGTLYTIRSEAEPFASSRQATSTSAAERRDIRHMRAALGSALLLASVTCGLAETPIIDFSGQTYHLGYQGRAKLPNGRLGDGVAEFTLPGETVDDWSKLFAFHAYPEAGDDPALAAAALGKVVKAVNKDANFALTADPKTGEAIIDFLTWAPGSDVMEFNVFKYAEAANGEGLVALQYAQHIKADDMDVADFRKLRQRTVEEMAHADVGTARDYFAKEASEEQMFDEEASATDD